MRVTIDLLTGHRASPEEDILPVFLRRGHGNPECAINHVVVVKVGTLDVGAVAKRKSYEAVISILSSLNLGEAVDIQVCNLQVVPTVRFKSDVSDSAVFVLGRVHSVHSHH